VIDAVDEAPPPGATELDACGSLLTPGLIDLHTHGIGRSLYERSPEDLLEGAAMLPRFGTTCVLPTLYRVFGREFMNHLSQLAAGLDQVTTVRFPGFHLEGPFLALPGAGAECLPGDLVLLDEILDACKGKAVVMSISPDTPNILPVIERLVEKGVIPFMTHTCASVAQTEVAMAAGAIHATHFYDVFPLPPVQTGGVRPCGAVEAILATPECSVDFIPDGTHVEPVAIRAALAAKGFRKVLLITDSNIGAGLPDGVHETPWGYSVLVKAGEGARVADEGHPKKGGLAGSALTMDAGIRNLFQWLDLPPEQIWAMGTSNAADLVRLHHLGRIQPGAAADLVLWNESLEVETTWLAGREVYRR
jgi:N-acetylglucosamine-6-phosphate deacetylase